MPELNYHHDKRRFETFMDAVIAIILTILVLELRVPENEHSAEISTRQQVLNLLPSFLSYIGSFLLIVGVWIDHSVLFQHVQTITKRYIVLNMFFILSLSIIPFTTAFAGHHYNDPFAVTLLFSNYFVMNLFFASLYWYGNYKGYVLKEFIEDNRTTAIYSMLGIIGLLGAIPLAFINTYWSFALGIIIFTGHLLKKK